MEQKLSFLNMHIQTFGFSFKPLVGVMILLLNVTWNSNCQDVDFKKNSKSSDRLFPDKEKNIDSLIRPRILFERNKATGKKIISFYSEEGKLVNSFPHDQVPDRNPYSKLRFPYYEGRGNGNEFNLSNFNNKSPNYGYFDLTGIELPTRKSIVKNSSVNIKDSIIQKATRIIRTPVRVVSMNDSFLLTNSYFYVIDEKNATIWRSEYISVYNYKSEIVKEFEINQNLGWEGCLSKDGRYLLMFQSLAHDEVGINGDSNAENWTEYGFPLNLLDLETGKASLINYEFEKSRVLEMKYFDNAFQLIYDTNEHVVINAKNKVFYYKSYGNRKKESDPLMLVIQKDKPDLSGYNRFNFN